MKARKQATGVKYVLAQVLVESLEYWLETSTVTLGNTVNDTRNITNTLKEEAFIGLLTTSKTINIIRDSSIQKFTVITSLQFVPNRM